MGPYLTKPDTSHEALHVARCAVFYPRIVVPTMFFLLPDVVIGSLEFCLLQRHAKLLHRQVREDRVRGETDCRRKPINMAACVQRQVRLS